MTDEPTISIRNVAYSYGETPVLDGVSVDVAPGELVGLVGPNGAGKSTLLRLVSGVLSPDQGTVFLEGRSVDELGSMATSRRVAVVPQSTTLSFSFDVRTVVDMGRHPYRNRFSRRTDEDRRIVDAAMERTGVAEFADRSIDAVSGGERQRVILARSIAQNTPALLLDEPTNNLDINHQIETAETVRSLVDEGRAGLAAIHDLGLAARYCDRIALLADGELLNVGAPETVLTGERIRSAFGTEAVVRPDPITDGVQITALPTTDDEGRIDDDKRTENGSQTDASKQTDDEDNPGERERRVHVLGHGEAAASLVGRLRRNAYSVTAGPVPEGDQVVRTADALGGRVLTTPPHVPLGSETIHELETVLEEADAVVVPPGDLPIGFDPVVEVVRGEPLVVVRDDDAGKAAPIDDRIDQHATVGSLATALDAVEAEPSDADGRPLPGG